MFTDLVEKVLVWMMTGYMGLVITPVLFVFIYWKTFDWFMNVWDRLEMTPFDYYVKKIGSIILFLVIYYGFILTRK
jgi:hypothetical protein